MLILCGAFLSRFSGNRPETATSLIPLIKSDADKELYCADFLP
jgi:hypothetical protein